MKTRLRHRLISFLIITTFLCQNIAWAKWNEPNHYIAPKSVFENFDKYFISKGINLPFHIKSKIFMGFNKISEGIFPLLPQREEELLQKGGLFKEITEIFSYCDSNFQEYIRFKPDTIKVITEGGDKSFSIDIELVQANISKTVIFYDPYRPPLGYLRGMSNTWTDEDETYARERGFWIIEDRGQLLIEEINRSAQEQGLNVFVLDDHDKLSKMKLPNSGFLIVPDGAKFVDDTTTSNKYTGSIMICQHILAAVFGISVLSQEMLMESFRRMGFVLRELFTNAIVHGNKGEYGRPVIIKWSWLDIPSAQKMGEKERCVVFEVYDTGKEAINYENKTPTEKIPQRLRHIAHHGMGRDVIASALCEARAVFDRKGNRVGNKVIYGVPIVDNRDSVQEIDINSALRILGAFLNQTEDIIPPEFIGFGWKERYPSREFLQAHLPEILDLATSGQIIVQLLPDGTIRFTKLRELMFGKGISGDQDDVEVGEKTEGSLILQDSPLSYLGRELGVNFYVSQSAKKEGFWKYELNLTDEERKVLEKNDIVTGYIGDRPTRIYIVFHNERPLYIVWHDKGMAFGYGLGSELGEEMKGSAKEWLEMDLKSSVIFMEQLFQYVVTDSGHRICCFKGVYEPSHDTSYIFQKGIRPRKGAKILVLGTGSGYDAILAVERGAREVVATDIDPVSVACAKFNIAQSEYRDRIKVYKADLFNIPDRPKDERFSSIYFNLPLDSAGGNFRVSDKGMVLFGRLLDEAKDYLEEGGTLEVTYEEIPAFFKKVYSKGWEPARIEGTLEVRQLMEGEHVFFDYGRFVLVRQKDRERIGDDLKKIISYWHELAEIKRLYDNHDISCTERLVKIKSAIEKDFGEREDFNAQLLIKGLNDLANYIYSILQKQHVSDPRVSEFYPEYMPSEGSGAMKKISVYSPLDEDNLRIAKEKESSWRQQAKGISVEKRTIKGKVIRAKFIDNARDLPEGLYLYYFYDAEGNLVIVNNTEFQEEAIYHEAREAFWQGKGLTRRKAHILACAEQVIRFSEKGKPTPFHESQLENVPIDEDRSYQHLIIGEYLGKDILQRITKYEFTLKILKYEKTVKKSNELVSECTKLGDIAQNIRGFTRLQFAVPFSVLKNAGDFTLALKKMGMLGRGDIIFELIIYDLESDIDSGKFIELLNLPKNIKVYTITKDEVGGSSDILKVEGIMQKRYPLRENDYLMIATDMVDEDKTGELKERLSSVKDERVSFGVVVKPDKTSVISLSRILKELLEGMDKGLTVKIILPLPISPQEIKKRLEEEVSALWKFLSAA